MKVVLLHDWLTGFRGGERVFEVFCELYPNAPIYTLFYEKGSTSGLIDQHKVCSSFLNRIPGVKNFYRKLLPFYPIAVECMSIVEEADLILSSSHCVIKGLKKPANAVHISYLHSPMRYIYDQFDNYFGKGKPLTQRIIAHLIRPLLKGWDLISNQNVDYFLANSKFVQKRIDEFYNKESKVINPFVDLVDFKHIQENPLEKQDFYLMVTAFAPNKRVDLAIKAFNDLGYQLKIVGGGQDEEMLKSLADDNIEFLGNVSREGVVDLFSKAKGFIFPGVEDFGITPLESMAAGTPIIAFKAGGVLETLNEEVAQFFDRPTKDSLIQAVKEFEKKSFSREGLFARANLYSKEKFKEQIQEFIKQKMSSS